MKISETITEEHCQVLCPLGPRGAEPAEAEPQRIFCLAACRPMQAHRHTLATGNPAEGHAAEAGTDMDLLGHFSRDKNG